MNNASGMILALLYAIAAVFCVFFATQERKRKAHPIYITLLWMLGLLLWAFGFQEASGAFKGVTQFWRNIARADQWYAQRHAFQAAIIGTIPAIGIIALGILLWFTRKEWRRYWLVVLTLTYLAGLGAIQLVSLHQVDELMRKKIMGIRTSTWGGIAGLGLSFMSFVALIKNQPGSHKASRR
jgi:type IV secretory pathway VirB2 component (pilin)